ncbi:galactose-1-epimerase [Vibrio sp. dsl-7]|uniref:Aldose 1-epimerase n=2 Tax=Vibrionaceae TaxID=641 RepID=A0ABT5UZD9_9VIBR|nr:MULTISPECIES: galactose-1-epimerase [Vibrio]MDE1513644.1 galactose-1-epimerase [Vibrio chanodichtyis]
MMSNFEQVTLAMGQSPSFDGQPAKFVHLTNAQGMSVVLMDIGATWLSCTLPVNGSEREVLLRSPNMEEHLKQGAYFGAIVGRFANRIAKGQFEIDGERYQLAINNGENALHGGWQGFDKRRWQIVEQSAQQVRFTLHSADGDQGYPGNLDVQVTYTLSDDNQLLIAYQAQTDKASPLNLTNHAYFNLAGEGAVANALTHKLQIHASHYLPTDNGLIPTGELKSVMGTSFDFNHAKLIGEELLSDQDQQIAQGYDHCLVFSDPVTDGIQAAAVLTAPAGDVQMTVKTTKPAMQFYSGNFLAGTPGRSKTYAAYDGVALETQYFPDGPNQRLWNGQAAILKAGERYQHQTCYQFVF